MTNPADLYTFCRLALQSRIHGRQLKRPHTLMPASKSTGVTRVDLRERLRVRHGITWTLGQVTSVLEQLIERKAVKKAGIGYQVCDWSVIEALVAEPVEAECEEVPA